MIIFIVFFLLCLFCCGLLAEYRSLPLWAWSGIISAVIALSLLFAGAHWLWAFLAIAPAIVLCFPAVRIKLIVNPWLEQLADFSASIPQTIYEAFPAAGELDNHSSRAANWLTALTTGQMSIKERHTSPHASTGYETQYPGLNAEMDSMHIQELSVKERKTVDEYCARLQKILNKKHKSAKHSQSSNPTDGSSRITARELVAAEATICGLRVATSYGGAGLSMHAVSTIVGRLAATNLHLAQLVAVLNSGVASLIASFATQRQKEKLLPAIAKGEVISCPLGFADAEHLEFYAVRSKSPESTAKSSKKKKGIIIKANTARAEHGSPLHASIISSVPADSARPADPAHPSDVDLLAVFLPVYDNASIYNKGDDAGDDNVNAVNQATQYTPHHYCWALINPNVFNAEKSSGAGLDTGAGSDSGSGSDSSSGSASKEPSGEHTPFPQQGIFVPEELIISGGSIEDGGNIEEGGDIEDAGSGSIEPGKSTSKQQLQAPVSMEQSAYHAAIIGTQSLIKAQKMSAIMATQIAKREQRQQAIKATAVQCQNAWQLKYSRAMHFNLSPTSNDAVNNDGSSRLIDEMLQQLCEYCEDYKDCKDYSSSVLSGRAGIAGITGRADRGLTNCQNYKYSTETDISLLVRDPYWRKMIEASDSQADNSSRLAAVDEWLGHYIGGFLRSFSLGMTGGINLSEYRAMIAGVIHKAKEMLSSRSITISPDENLVKNSPLRHRWNHLSAASGFILQTMFIVRVIKGGSVNNMANIMANTTPDTTPSLSGLLGRLLALNASLIAEQSEDNSEHNSADNQQLARVYWNDSVYQARNELAILINNLPCHAIIITIMRPLLLPFAWNYRPPTAAEEFQLAEIWAVPSVQREELFAELNKQHNSYKEVEEVVRLAWLVKEIYDRLFEENINYPINTPINTPLNASPLNTPRAMNTNEWQAKLLEDGIINADDVKIMDDFHKKSYILSNDVC